MASAPGSLQRPRDLPEHRGGVLRHHVAVHDHEALQIGCVGELQELSAERGLVFHQEELRDPRRSVRPLPISLVIDCAGNDAYESTHDGAQGFGLLGVGVLVDVAGDDTYLGQRWAQGAGFLGLGILIDDGGSDRYRSEGLSQGTALFGAAALELKRRIETAPNSTDNTEEAADVPARN